MATLSWNEIRSRAIKFSNEWKNETSEEAEAKSFWDDFFHVFGISRKKVAIFEKKVKKIDGKDGYIDLLWKGILLIEHKSRGKNLDRAYNQAKDYFPGLKESELPEYILVSDFWNFNLYELESNENWKFTIEELPNHIKLFGFIAGYRKQEYKEEDPVNIDAAQKMGLLHDKLKDIGYQGHDLEVYLVRLLFCLFADDTGIFERNLFRDYIEYRTKEDGSDLAGHLEGIFDTLNTPENERLKTIDENLNQFPYVNGNLFAERLRYACFDSNMRNLLLDCSALDWGRISPAIFGSLFQSVTNQEERRKLGAHYTSEVNILKVIKSLFLDELWDEFHLVKNNRRKLEEFHKKISSLKFLDPACGCGNFLIIAYRELRLLELEVLRERQKRQMVTDISTLVIIDVDQFYGIELDEFASQIAQVALWLMDHQMNMMLSLEFGQYFIRLPLKKRPNIINTDALKLDWNSIVPNSQLSYILGNPPFVGYYLMSPEQKEDMKHITENIENAGTLDYVTAWYIKAAEYIQDTDIRVGFVSTNSIVQGIQAIVLWKYLMEEKGIDIFFAHQTFKWNNEARGRAAVYCVIIGFSLIKELPKTIFTYPDITSDPTIQAVKNINQYLLDAPTIFIETRPQPISPVSEMLYGTKPADGGHFIFTETDMKEFIEQEPLSEKYFRPFLGAHEVVNGYQRYCLYLKDCPPSELRKMPLVIRRVENVRQLRQHSKKAATRKWAEIPTLFMEDRVTDGDILIIPIHTSENRRIIPIGYFKSRTICSNAAFQVVNASIYIFGILNSAIHMAWMRTVCGRLKSDYRYSNTIVYNNFVFPDPTDKQKQDIEKKAQKIIEIRDRYSTSTLSDLYNPLSMPSDLVKAHHELYKLNQ